MESPPNESGGTTRAGAGLASGAPGPPSRWTLVRDLAAFQVKLVVDGLRDVLLSPASLIVAIIGLASGRRELFYDLLVLGRRSERWIDLFRAASRVSPPQPGPPWTGWPPHLPYGPGWGNTPPPGTGPAQGSGPATGWYGQVHRPAPGTVPEDDAPQPLTRAEGAAGAGRERAGAHGAGTAPHGGRTAWYTDDRWSGSGRSGDAGVESIVDLIDEIEARLQEQYRRGGLTARAKHSIDRMLDSLERQTRRGGGRDRRRGGGA